MTEYLNKLYFSNQNSCCKCGTQLESANLPLGSIFVLDKNGNFYCTQCDGEFDDIDERIFEPEEEFIECERCGIRYPASEIIEFQFKDTCKSCLEEINYLFLQSR